MKLDFEIDLNNLYPETWFGDTPGKRVCLRLCPAETIDEFRKECRKERKQAVLNTESRKMELVDDSDFDADKFFNLLNGYSVVDWDLTDSKGTAIPCTDDNKRLLMQIPRFVQFVKECLAELNKAIGAKNEDEIKNSLAG